MIRECELDLAVGSRPMHRLIQLTRTLTCSSSDPTSRADNMLINTEIYAFCLLYKEHLHRFIQNFIRVTL